ncbi:MAG: DUF2459 domain-containing protein [Alphaproteobacteria bacterium]
MIALGALACVRPAGAAPPCRPVYILRHEWHAGIIVDRRDVAADFGLNTPDLLAKEWLEFGWGDEDFYQTPDAGLLLGLKAIFLRNDSVMHVHAFDGAPDRVFPQSEVVALRLPAEGYARLLAFIRASFKRDAESRVRRLGPGLYGLSYFYEGEGAYHAFRTCNTWAAEALAAGGFPIDPSGLVTVGQLMDGLRGKMAAGCASAEAG